jgi:hypothetical protein
MHVDIYFFLDAYSKSCDTYSKPEMTYYLAFAEAKVAMNDYARVFASVYFKMFPFFIYLFIHKGSSP